jgi:hypothetical protein
MWEKGEKTEKQPVAVYDVAKGITAIAKDPKNTAGKTYQFVGYGYIITFDCIVIPLIFIKC